jgi:hypothetical protein
MASEWPLMVSEETGPQVELSGVARRPAQFVAIDVVVAGDDEEVEVGGGEDAVEERSGGIVFGGFAGVGDVAGGENEVGAAAAGVVVGDGFDEGAEDDVAVVGVAGFHMEIGDMQPGEGIANKISRRREMGNGVF